jgi:hypothetical protein
MGRNRIIYQSLALFAGQTGIGLTHTGVGSIRQLSRVQSWDSDFSRSFTDINQYGQLASIDRIELEAPTVNMSTSWYPTNGFNERLVGLSVARSGQTVIPSLLSGILKKETDEKNYFLMVADEGSDAVGYTQPRTGVFGVGNAFLTSYSLEAAVGDVPTASADFEALNFAVYSGVYTGVPTGDNFNELPILPAIIPQSGIPVTGRFRIPIATANNTTGQVPVLRPGDITFNLKPAGAISPTNPAFVKGLNADDIKVQSITLSTDLSRTPIEKLGSRFPFSREIDFPITATLSVDAQLGDLEDFNLSDLLCETGFYNLSVTFKQNSCSGDGDPALIVQLRGAKLVSESVSTAIGDNASVTLEYEASIGGPEETGVGLFMSGTYPASAL